MNFGVLFLLYFILYECSESKKCYITEEIDDEGCFPEEIEICDHSFDTITHNVMLLKKYESSKEYKTIESIQYNPRISEYSYNVEIWNDFEIERIRSFIEASQECENFHFIFKSQENIKDQINYINYFLERLKEQKIFKVRVSIEKDDFLQKFYKYDMLYYEIYENKLKVSLSYKFFQLIIGFRMEIDNEEINEIIKERKLSTKIVDINKPEELLLNYLYNHNLFFCNLDSIEKEAMKIQDCLEIPILNFESKCENSEKKIQEKSEITFNELSTLYLQTKDMKPPLVLLFLLKNTDYLKNAIVRILSSYETEKYCLFKAIIKNFENNFFDDYESNANNPILLNSNCNENYLSLAESICDLINNLELKRNMPNYKMFLLFFYQFIKKDLEINENFDFMMKHVSDNSLRNLRHLIVRELNKKLIAKYFFFLGDVNKTIVLGFYGERENILTEVETNTMGN